jgi:hypothetical protein
MLLVSLLHTLPCFLVYVVNSWEMLLVPRPESEALSKVVKEKPPGRSPVSVYPNHLVGDVLHHGLASGREQSVPGAVLKPV